MTTPSHKDLAAGFQRLLTAAKDSPPRPRLLVPVMSTSAPARPGDVWIASGGELAGQYPTETEGILLLVVADTGMDSRLGRVLRVAPVFSEIELASFEDAILPSHVLGWEAGIALGCESPLAQDSLKRCVGHLPEEWTRRIDAFRHRLEDESIPFPDGILTGRPFTDDRDPGFLFHESLVQRMTELMEPVLCEVLSPAAIPRTQVSQWLREEWQSWMAAARQAGRTVQDSTQGLLDWAEGHLAHFEFSVPAPAGFKADDEQRAGGVQVTEFRVVDSGAWFHIVREIPARAELMLQVLEDPSGSLEGAEILDVDGGVLATVRGGLSSHPFEVRDGSLLIRLASGSLALLTRVDA
ncbi:hypothetical protein GCM10023213_39100 [Prosthecobacter algae]|uniref:Uncharacterized protein n=1 Tax=Prosthecobacter algae TaxID=1144682 RepID=A0ABP9PIM2_9BACT